MIYPELVVDRLSKMKNYFEAGDIECLKNSIETVGWALVGYPELQKQFMEFQTTKKSTLDTKLKEIENEDRDLREPMSQRLEIEYFLDIIMELEKMIAEKLK